MAEENMHDGHRARMLKRFAEYPDSFSDHELVEIMLYPVLKRVDTNPVAHELLNSFKTLNNIFNATPEQLKLVKGVGDRTADYLSLTGVMIKRLGEDLKKEKKLNLFNFDAVCRELAKEYRGADREMMAIYYLDGNYDLIYMNKFADKRSSVEFSASDIPKQIAAHKPKHLIMAHNHPSGRAEPSRSDDKSTAKMCLLCSVHNVGIADHVIVAGDKFFSYYQTGRLERIQQKYVDDKFIDDVFINNLNEEPTRRD